MVDVPRSLDVTFTAPIGVEVKEEIWSCVEMPDSVPITAAFLPMGTGGHMLSISAKLRKKLGKEVGDVVVVHLSERLS